MVASNCMDTSKRTFAQLSVHVHACAHVCMGAYKRAWVHLSMHRRIQAYIDASQRAWTNLDGCIRAEVHVPPSCYIQGRVHPITIYIFRTRLYNYNSIAFTTIAYSAKT